MRSCLGLGRLLDPHARAPVWMRSMRVPALIRGSSMSRYARHGVERSSVRARIKKWIAGASAAALAVASLATSLGVMPIFTSFRKVKQKQRSLALLQEKFFSEKRNFLCWVSLQQDASDAMLISSELLHIRSTA